MSEEIALHMHSFIVRSPRSGTLDLTGREISKIEKNLYCKELEDLGLIHISTGELVGHSIQLQFFRLNRHGTLENQLSMISKVINPILCNIDLSGIEKHDS